MPNYLISLLQIRYIYNHAILERFICMICFWTLWSIHTENKNLLSRGFGYTIQLCIWIQNKPCWLMLAQIEEGLQYYTIYGNKPGWHCPPIGTKPGAPRYYVPNERYSFQTLGCHNRWAGSPEFIIFEYFMEWRFRTSEVNIFTQENRQKLSSTHFV